MADRRPRKPRPPLDSDTLDELALAYVARFATTRAKLAAYLRRKLGERGWSAGGDPPVEPLVERLANAGLVDDRSFAVAKSESLTRRGYGRARVQNALRIAGVGDADGAEALDAASASAAQAALRFAQRRRFGPFASAPIADRKERDRQLGAMIRAGHSFALSSAILAAAPGDVPDPADLPGGR